MGDQLSRFRREQPATRADTPIATVGKRTYEAFDKTGRPSLYTEIRSIMQPSQSPQFRFFIAAVFSTDYDDNFTLIYSYMAVEIKGKHLKEVRRAIQNGRCEFIQEFHKNEFIPPGKGEPVIESIKFITGEKLDDILSSYREGK